MRSLCAFMNPHRFQHPIPRGSTHEDIWLSGVKFPDIIIIHRGWNEWKYYCNYTTWTPKHVHTFIFTHTHTYARMHTHASARAEAHTYTHTLKRTHACLYTHTHTHTHTHTLAICCTYNIYLQTDRCKRGLTGRNQSHAVVISSNSVAYYTFIFLTY